MRIEKNRIALVVAAHPDDEVLGCGATMARMADAGMAVYVVYVATGITSRYEDRDSAKKRMDRELAQLQDHAGQACEILGVKESWFLNFPDNRLDAVSRMDIVWELKKVARNVKPDMVFTHHHGDYNWDHTAVYDAVLMAFRANSGESFPDGIYTFEVLSATERASQSPPFIFTPNIWVDTGDYITRKIDALKCYQSELGEYPHPRSEKAVRILSHKRGIDVGLDHAEAFHCVRQILSKDEIVHV